MNKKLNDAVEEYQAKKHAGEKTSYKKVAEKFNINHTTLASLEQGKHQSMSTFNTLKQKLTPAEEKVLVEAIVLASPQGIPYTHKCQGTWHWGDYPVRPRGNPQPQGILLSIYFNAY